MSANGLVVYSAACKALAAARTTDEVRKIRNDAAMLRAYAKQAKNRQLELDAAEIRIRAERRVGELMDAQKKSVGLNKGSRLVGRNRTRQDDKPTLDAAGIDKHLADRARKLAAVPETRFESLVADWRGRHERAGERITSELLRPKMDVHHSSETPEHYTPICILNAVIECFGAIDLDPCSNSGRPNVPAAEHFKAADDGLSRAWRGRVFMNPPYGREIGDWIAKLIREWTGDVTEAIALVPSRTDTDWFEELTRANDDLVVCFVHGRLTFIGNTDPAPFPSMVAYLGPHHDRFAEVFGGMGGLWVRPGAPSQWFVDHEPESIVRTKG